MPIIPKVTATELNIDRPTAIGVNAVMIESYWGLQFNPFQNVLNDDWYYSSPMHDEALSRLYTCSNSGIAAAC